MSHASRTAPTRFTAPGNTALSRAFPTPQALQARYQIVAQQQCQQCED